MPPIETAWRYDKAVLWPVLTKLGRIVTDSHGRPRVSTNPVELDVRWEDTETEALDPEGNTVRIDATVVVDREIVPGSLMRKGELADWTGTGSGNEDTEVMVVKTYQRVEDIKGRHVRRVVGLARFRNQPGPY